MPKYSSGPFMNMSPSGTPGLLMVIFVVFAVLCLFVPRTYYPALSLTFLIAIVLVFALGIHTQFRQPNSDRPPSVLHLSEPSSESPVAPFNPQDQADAYFTRQQRFRVFFMEAVVLVAAVTLTLSGLVIAGILEIPELGQVWLIAALVFLTAAVVALLSVAVARRRKSRRAGAA